MGECEADVWVSDCWKAQLNAPARLYQICLTHQIRNLQGSDRSATAVAVGQRNAGLVPQSHSPGKSPAAITERGYQRQVLILHKDLERLLQRRFHGLGTNLLERYRKYRDSLFVFLQRCDVPPDNNACERALRPSVIHRKVMGSFRSEWGPQAYAALTTVLNTAKRHGQSAFQKLVSLMGTPVLPFLDQPVFA